MGIKILKPFLGLVLAAAIGFAVFQHTRQWPLKTINHLLAYLHSDDLFALEELQSPACADWTVRRWIQYLHMITQFMPQLAESHALLGACYAYVHDDDKAIEALNRAVAINPHIWSFHYNLGVVYARQNNLPLAQLNFQKAADTDPRLNAAHIANSKIYRDLIHKRLRPSEFDLGQRLMDNYRQNLLALQFPNNPHLPVRLF